MVKFHVINLKNYINLFPPKVFDNLSVASRLFFYSILMKTIENNVTRKPKVAGLKPLKFAPQLVLMSGPTVALLSLL